MIRNQPPSRKGFPKPCTFVDSFIGLLRSMTPNGRRYDSRPIKPRSYAISLSSRNRLPMTEHIYVSRTAFLARCRDKGMRAPFFQSLRYRRGGRMPETRQCREKDIRSMACTLSQSTLFYLESQRSSRPTDPMHFLTRSSLDFRQYPDVGTFSHESIHSCTSHPPPQN